MAEPTTTNDTAALIQAGNAALLAGDTYSARQHFRQAIELDPEIAEAWIGLAGSVRPYREKREHVQRALSIAPDHPDARAVLAHVEAKLAAGEVLAPGGVTVREPLPEPAIMETPPEPIVPVGETLYCYNHPNRETGLRCTSCDRAICTDCATPTPVGQICPECARIRRPVNYQVEWQHLAVAAIVSFFYGAVTTFLALYLFGMIRFFAIILAFLLGPASGNLLVRGLEPITAKKRGRAMQLAVGIGYGIGAVPLVAVLILFGGGFTGLILALFVGLSIFTAVNSLR